MGGELREQNARDGVASGGVVEGKDTDEACMWSGGGAGDYQRAREGAAVAGREVDAVNRGESRAKGDDGAHDGFNGYGRASE